MVQVAGLVNPWVQVFRLLKAWSGGRSRLAAFRV